MEFHTAPAAVGAFRVPGQAHPAHFHRPLPLPYPGQAAGFPICPVPVRAGRLRVRGNTTEEIINVKLLADTIGIYLRLQSEEARNAFIGRYYFLDSLKEVAAYCGMSESKCKSLLYRTRVGLKEYLEKEGFSV